MKEWPDMAPAANLQVGKTARHDVLVDSKGRWTGVRSLVSALNVGLQSLSGLTALAVIVLLPLSLLATVLIPQARFFSVGTGVDVMLDGGAVIASLLGTLILVLFPIDHHGDRWRWVALGVGLAGGVGSLGDAIRTLTHLPTDVRGALAVSLLVWIAAGVCFAVGMVPQSVPSLTVRRVGMMAAVLILLVAGTLVVARYLPTVVSERAVVQAARHGDIPAPGELGWVRVLSILPLGLAVAGAWGAARRFREEALERWLMAAILLWTGVMMYAVLFPPQFIGVATPAHVMRLLFGGLVAVAAVFELDGVTRGQAMLLRAEQAETRRLAELGVLKANFTAMVAHELGSPLAAIRTLTAMLQTGDLGVQDRTQALAAIERETDVLAGLVADVRSAALVERDDFSIQPRPVQLRALLTDAASFAKTLPGDHPFVMPVEAHNMVWADPERISQVLRNLLNNAAKYSPAGTPIELRMSTNDERVCIQVIDKGYGIHPNDLTRIFEKFGRGRDSSGERIQGMGLGLYLSSRIVRAHDSQLSVTSQLGAGSTFGFDLEIVL